MSWCGRSEGSKLGRHRHTSNYSSFSSVLDRKLYNEPMMESWTMVSFVYDIAMLFFQTWDYFDNSSWPSTSQGQIFAKDSPARTFVSKLWDGFLNFLKGCILHSIQGLWFCLLSIKYYIISYSRKEERAYTLSSINSKHGWKEEEISIMGDICEYIRSWRYAKQQFVDGHPVSKCLGIPGYPRTYVVTCFCHSIPITQIKACSFPNSGLVRSYPFHRMPCLLPSWCRWKSWCRWCRR